MKLSRLIFTTSTALGLSMTAVLADGNETELAQSGNDNSTLIDQSLATNSDVGVLGSIPAATQNGDDNVLVISQAGDANRIASNAAAAILLQDGTENNASIEQSRTIPPTSPSTSTGNVVTVMRQEGAGNDVTISQTSDQNRNYANVRQNNAGNSADGNTASVTQVNTAPDNQNANRNEVSSGPGHVGGVVQNGKRNTAAVEQQGQGLRLRLLEQVGDDNDANVVLTGVDNGQPDLTVGGPSGSVGAFSREVLQLGDLNQTDVNISGMANAYGVKQQGNENDALGIMVTGNNNSVGVGQFGDLNEISLATVAGDLNSIGFEQVGNENFALATVNGNQNEALVSQVGDRNETRLDIDGSFNEAELKVTGDDNYLNGFQKQRRNDMFVTLDGSGNNNLLASDPFNGSALIARDFVRASGGLKSADFRRGDLIQIGYGGSGNSRNSVFITGTNADNNSFATYQNGNRNATVGSITDGTMNQAVVAQIGDDNSATFSQVGNGNNAGIIQ